MNTWLKIFTLFLVVILSACNDDENIVVPTDPALDFEITPGMNLAGKVIADNKALAGVVVSDGYTVTVTNADGIYEMKRDERAKFVTISLPADCKVPVNGNIAALYAPIDHSQAVIKADFLLNQGTVENDFVLVALADPQAGSGYEISRFKNESVDELVRAGKQNAGRVPHYGIVLGDIVWDQMALFDGMKSAMNSIPFPFFPVIGNHDHDLKVENDDYNSSAIYESYFGPRYYSFNRGECHFIVLDDVDYIGGADKRYNAKISAEQIAWLKKDLSYVDKDKLIIVGVHIPTKRRATNSQVSNNGELYAALEGYEVQILSAHTHYNENVTISDRIEEHIHGAVCGAFWSGDVNLDGSPNGYGVYEISGNRVKNWYYKATREDKSWQMRLYSSSTLPPVQGKIGANIWNWHSDWTVKVFENGVDMGDMERIRGREFDPFAYDFLTVKASAHPHPTVALATETDHLFYYTPADPNARVKVVATDKYGNVYSEEI